MNVVDKDLKKNQKKNLADRQEASVEPEDMELNVMATANLFLNEGGSLFDEAAKEAWGGINTAPSVFSSQAVFHTKNNST